jgi:hypothetical protein
MSHNVPTAPESAADQLFQLCLGYIPAICLNVAAKLSVAELLAEGPKTAEEIAAARDVDADALYRVLRALSAFGVFQEAAPRRFAQTPASDLLRADHPRSLRPFVMFFPDPLHFRAYAHLMHSVKTGETTAGPAFGRPLFDFFKDNPGESAIFNAAMVNITQMFIPAILEAYDFGQTRLLADIGGGHGSVLASVLQRYPNMKGVLFDLPHVVAGATPYLQSMGVGERCTIIAGDFFDTIPAGADTYIMKNIIHDWSDEKALTILKNTRAALDQRPEKGKLLLLELVVPPGNEPHLSKLADIEMLVLPGGRERTEEEYRRLLNSGGFHLTRVVTTKSGQSVIEAVAD